MSGKIEEFEDLIAWQKARELNREIYAAAKRDDFSKDFALRDQICRASISIMSNIAEGFERGNPREFHQFLSIAKASCAGVRSQLYVALDAGYLTETQFHNLMKVAREVGRVLGGLRASVARRRDGS